MVTDPKMILTVKISTQMPVIRGLNRGCCHAPNPVPLHEFKRLLLSPQFTLAVVITSFPLSLSQNFSLSILKNGDVKKLTKSESVKVSAEA